jgi:hypothetical protein
MDGCRRSPAEQIEMHACVSSAVWMPALLHVRGTQIIGKQRIRDVHVGYL